MGGNSKVKVCHMTSAHPVEDVRIFHKECVSLANYGYDVYLVERGESYDKEGVHIVGVGDIPESRRKRMTQGARAVYRKALELDCDIYHFHDPELLPIGLKLKKRGKHVIFDSHENTADAIIEKQYIPKIIRIILQRLYVSYQSFVCKRLDGIVTVTPNMTKSFEKTSRNVVEIRNYPILSQSDNNPSFADKRIVFAGGISEQWNHHVIIDVLNSIPDCKYCLCGPVDANYKKRLEALPGWEKVDYRGRISHSEVAVEMNKSFVGVALLRPGRNTDGQNGTMGNTKIFEEMMAGLPVICTDFVLWKEFVERYHCGICIDPSSEEELRGALEYLFNHPSEAMKMGQNGKDAVLKEFNWNIEAVKLLNFYGGIVNR